MLKIEVNDLEGTFDSEEEVEGEWTSTILGGAITDVIAVKREFLLGFFGLEEKD
jgi:hypothetical protein